MKIPVRIGIAGGKEKTEAISAAVKGGYINVLITDLQTAKDLLAYRKEGGKIILHVPFAVM